MEELLSSIDYIMIYKLILLPDHFIRYAQLFPAFCPAVCQHSSAIGCRHSLPETMLVSSFPVRWLKCPFHCSELFFDQSFLGAAKVMFFLFHTKLYFLP